jgi:uncharacterized repeat protein (TIGR02543 family)
MKRAAISLFTLVLLITSCAVPQLEILATHYTVQFNLNYAGAIDTPPSVSVEKGDKVAEPNDPSRAGYAFEGWYREAACATSWDFSVDMVSSSMTLFAKWTANPAPGSQIIADHSVVADFGIIPAQYIAAVKKMMVSFPGESHSAAYRTGMELLEAADSRYACNVSTGEAPTDQYVRVNNSGAGEATWYTWYAYDGHGGANKDVIENSIKEYADHGHPMHAIGFGWCWDTTWINNPGGTVDPVYKVRWAGSSDGGPDGNLIWGLDAGDFALTGNRVCMDSYLEATESYRQYCADSGYPTKAIFTTGPVDGYTGESGYQRQLKHEYIRAYVQADPRRILFDYADILCYNDDGAQNIQSWTDGGGGVHSFPMITATNLGDGSIGHIGSAGAIRLAKAQWWMLARIAGWDGVSTD